jgi:hypothetical protein
MLDAFTRGCGAARLLMSSNQFWEALMAVDVAKYLADVKKWAPNTDEVAVGGIVKYLGIALRSKDASLVSGTDPVELQRVVNNFLKKKLALTDSDDALMSSVKSVVEKMKADKTKERVTVYYLLADHYKKLSLFHPKKK